MSGANHFPHAAGLDGFKGIPTPPKDLDELLAADTSAVHADIDRCLDGRRPLAAVNFEPGIGVDELDLSAYAVHTRMQV
jgi:hypothetical protein